MTKREKRQPRFVGVVSICDGDLNILSILGVTHAWHDRKDALECALKLCNRFRRRKSIKDIRSRGEGANSIEFDITKVLQA